MIFQEDLEFIYLFFFEEKVRRFIWYSRDSRPFLKSKVATILKQYEVIEEIIIPRSQEFERF